MEKIEAEEALTATQEPPEWIVEFLELLKNPNVFTLKLKDIYPLAPYSQSMLNIYFNKYMGMTLITHITNLKISYACNLLRYTDASTLDISSQLAYDSLSHFNRIFKKITGKTPIEYKKTIDT
jgi:AraC-like DNA-binding protein